MVAVIPFSPEQPGAADTVPLGQILTYVLTAVLHRSRLIKVIAFQSAVQFHQRAATVRQIARALDADYVVTGRYRRQGRGVAVMLQVADGHTQELLNERTVTGLQSEVRVEDSALVTGLATSIVSEIVRAEVPRARHTPLPDLRSHTLLLAGIHLMFRLSTSDYHLAHEALQTLHQRVPRHAVPLAWLSQWHLFRLFQDWSQDRPKDSRQAEEYADRALQIDGESSLALTMMGYVRTACHRDFDGALQRFDQALAINPNESLALLQKGNTLSFAGDGAAGLTCAEAALRLSPVDPARHHYLTLLAGAALSAGLWDRAIDTSASSLVLNPRHASTHRIHAIALACSGRLPEARAAVTRLLQLQPELTVASYMRDSPGKPELVRQFALALGQAGLPAGTTRL